MPARPRARPDSCAIQGAARARPPRRVYSADAVVRGGSARLQRWFWGCARVAVWSALSWIDPAVPGGAGHDEYESSLGILL